VLRLAEGQALAAGETASVTIIAVDRTGLSLSRVFPVSTQAGARSMATLELLKAPLASRVPGAAPGNLTASLAAYEVGATSCSRSGAAAGPFTTAPAPTGLDGAALPLPGVFELARVSAPDAYLGGEPLFLRVVDADANLDAGARDRVVVRLAVPSTGDLEFVALEETGVDSGEFVGVVDSERGEGGAGDCMLGAGSGARVVVDYVDARDGTDAVATQTRIDPVGRVFDAASGRPIDGARLRLVDLATGSPAQLSAEAPGATYPADLVSGGEAVAGDGRRYDFGPGAFRYPVVTPGRYRLEVVPPNRFRFPSSATDAQLQALEGAPFAVGIAGRGQQFDLPVGAGLWIDVPLDVAELGPTPSRIELLALAAGGANAESILISPTACGATGAALPTTAAGALIDLPSALSLAPASAFAAGDTLFLRVFDRDADLDPFAPDSIVLSLQIPSSGDSETLTLRETGPSTGRFTGHLPLASGAATAADCRLSGAADARMIARYVDADDATDLSSAEATLDPSGRIFDAATGAPVDGASVALVDAVTGAPATVFAADGVTPHPSTLVTGQPFTDAAGTVYDLGSGRYRFPLVTPGTYRLEVVPPEAWRFPSSAEDAELQSLEAGPFALAPASRGAELVVVEGRLPRIDVPLDPVRVDLFLSKQARAPAVAIGDFLAWDIRVQNPSTFALADVVLEDVLPPGFRYQQGSLATDGEAPAELSVAPDGRSLSLRLASLPAGAELGLRYVTEVTAGARLGDAVNRVQASGPGVRGSNLAEARVAVREDLLRDQAILLGRVRIGDCGQDEALQTGLAGARVYLENGTYVVTDTEGRWHIEGVEPGTHVVQLDRATLPADLEPVHCEDGNRFAGTSFSQFVDVQGGSLWRADFLLRPIGGQEETVRQRLSGRAEGRRAHLQLDLDGGALTLTDLTVSIALPEGLAYVPGSARLDGRPYADPEDGGATVLTWRMGDLPAGPPGVLAFSLTPRDSSFGPGQTAELGGAVRSLVQFRDGNQARRRLPPAELVIREATDPGLSSSKVPEAGVSVADAASAAAPPSGKARPDATPAVNADGTAPASAGPRVLSARERRVLAAAGDAPSLAAGPLLLIDADAAAIQEAIIKVEAAPRQQPALEEVEDAPQVPAFDAAGLTAVAAPRAIVWPDASFLPRIPATWVAVKHAPDERVALFVDGVPVSPLQFDRTDRYPDAGVAVSVWRGVTLAEGANALSARVERGGEVQETLTTTVRFSGAPVRAEFVPEHSQLSADGVEPAVIAVRFHDRDGYLVRPGMTGRFDVSAPYRPARVESERTRLGLSENDAQRGVYQVQRDGIAYLRLEPTTIAGEGEIRFEFSDQRQDLLRFRLVPAMRDWILVGFAEGTAGYETLSGNMVSARDAGLGEDWTGSGRVALFAKGAIAGKWLLTMAYDSDKPGSDRLGNQIDPNRFYTLYADGAEQRFEAESQRKLYLKIERGTFQALFGDYDTGLTVTELTRFSRRMTGLQSQYEDADWSVQAFASEADQAFLRDDLRGDGTSGLYRLRGEGVIANSERIRIEVRDRLRTERVLETRPLTRFTDYAIDYDAGTLLFREPVPSQDDALNPVFVVVEYETEGDGRRDLIAGARVAHKFGEAGSEIAVTGILDDTTAREQRLAGLDATWQFAEQSRLRAELAWSRAEAPEETRDGTAWLLEAEHAMGTLRASAYAREQETGFGLGQQFAGNGGLRRFGAALTQDLSGPLSVRGEAWQETQLDSGDERRVAETQLQWQDGETRIAGGLRSVSEAREAGELSSQLLTALLGRSVLDGRLRLTGDAEYALGGEGENIDFPTRLGAGADYQLFAGLELFARQEWSYADLRDTQDTRIGVDARPWQGASLGGGVGRRFDEQGERLFATTGLVQNLRLGERWRMDLGLDREQTLRDDRGLAPSAPDDPEARNPGGFNPRVPPVVGPGSDDFTAAYLGVGYGHAQWELTSRLERRVADSEDRWNLLAGAARQLDDGRILGLRLELQTRDAATGARSERLVTRLGGAWRPAASRWTVLNRLDLAFDRNEDGGFEADTRKLVHNLSANVRPDARSQLSLSWGLKYVLAEIDGQRYSGVTDLYGFEYRRDIARRWDIGLHGSALHSWSSDVTDWHAGLSVGHNPATNTWVSVGYNFVGFVDEDFAAAEYSQRGPYLKFRLKVDQESVRDYLGSLPFTLR
jgi:uncharacterized repeat protein (TIGR01451 family)